MLQHANCSKSYTFVNCYSWDTISANWKPFQAERFRTTPPADQQGVFSRSHRGAVEHVEAMGTFPHAIARSSRSKSRTKPDANNGRKHSVTSRKSNNQHARTRKDHATELAEDYVEAIAEIQQARGKCRVADLAKEFSVTHVTVNRTIGRLQRDGLVTTEPYGPIELTEAGDRLAREARLRHEIVVEFLKAIGVPEQIAIHDSEGIEHHVSPETLAAMKRLIKRQ